MKRISALLLAVAMVLAVVGCGTGNAQPTEAATTAAATQAAATEAATTAAAAAADTTTAAAAATTAAAAATTAAATTAQQAAETTQADTSTPEGFKHYGDVRLTMLNVWNGSGEGISKVDWENNDVAKAIREKIGVTVIREGIMMNETEKLNLVFASGDMPDFMDAAYWASPSGENTVIKRAATEGMLLPIDDYFDEFPDLLRAYEVGVIAQKFKDVDVEDPIFGGKHYVLPCETPGNTENIRRWNYGLTVRGDIPDLVGIPADSVHTPDDLYDFLRAIKDNGIKDINGNDVIPLSTRHNGWSLDMAYVWWTFHDGPYLTSFRKDDAGNTTVFALTQQYKDAVLYIRKLVSEGLLDKECFTHSDAQADAKAATGSLGVVGAMYNPNRDAEMKSGLRDSHPEMKGKPLGPMYYGNGKPFEQIELNGRNGSHVWIFPTTNKNLEATLAWIAYMNTIEGLTLMRYGFEGDTFEYNEQGQPRRLQSINDALNDPNPDVYEGMRDLLRAKGVNQYTMLYGDMSVNWFGERGAGVADAEDPDEKAFVTNNIRPLNLLDGYPIDGLLPFFPRSEDYFNLMAGERERMAREKAYFASTDEEAIAIIDEYLNYLTTGENAALPELLKYIDDNLGTRSDWLY